ncbi:MAG: pitrilysin family protein [Candidatus Pacebacteria bacterium]|nr:pitrilysin family protein [Candidatus Paceibacterota bacterium]
MYKKTAQKNGLRVITVPDSGTKAVTVLVLVGTGSKYERKEINGISHFLEHMYFKGTKKRNTPLMVAELLDKVGGIYNAFTGEECTGYFAKVSAGHFDLALDWVSDIYLNSLFPPKEIEKERKVITEEINMILDTPMAYVGEVWKKLLYGDQPAGWDIAGTKESVGKITRKQILDYKNSQYVAQNTVVCIAGNFKENAALKRVKECFSGIPASPSAERFKVKEEQSKPECLIYNKKTDQTHFCLGVRTYNISHPQRYTLELLGVILGGMMSSRLFTEIREKLGLAYYVKADADQDQDSGCLVAQAGVDNQRIDLAISAVLREYKKISQFKVGQEELKKAKENLKGKLALMLESSDANASFYAGQEILEKNILTPEEIFKKIDRVSAIDILKVAKDIFCPEKLNLALIGPFEDKERFIKLLKFN